MKISDAIICWTPDQSGYSSGMRGKIRIFAAPGGIEHIAPFPRRAGHGDARAHDAREEVRQAYALMIGFVLSQRDGIDPSTVHAAMLQIDEYRDGCAPELQTEGKLINPQENRS